MDIDTNIPRIVPGKTDAEIAEAFRSEARPHLDAWANIVTRAKAAGFVMNFSVNLDSFGRSYRVNEISVVKPL